MYTTHRKCPICYRIIYGSTLYKAKTKKFCTCDCFRIDNIRRHKVEKFCPTCGNQMQARTSYDLKDKKFCSMKCKRHTQETKEAIRKKKTGQKVHSEEWKNYLRKQVDEKSPSWKGDNVGYFGLHSWVIRKLDRPKKCENCKTTKAKRFEWANKSGLYKRDLTDWIRLCTSCHRKYDNPR